MAASCSKDTKINQVARDPAEIISAVVSKLSTADSISVFVNALKNLKLTNQEAEDGITLFIPVNGDSGEPNKVGFVSDSVVQLSDAVLRDHIIKGVWDYANLAVTKSFQTLSGRSVKVTRSADTIWINGVQMSGWQKAVSNNFTVHTVKTSLSLSNHFDTLTTTSLDVTVWDASRWAVGKPKGEIAPNTIVKAYSSIQNYNDGLAAATGITNYQGRALLKKLGVGTYFLEANLNGKSNVFVSTVLPSLGFKAGYASSGLFQNVQEVNSAPSQTNAKPGNFRWIDNNSDGKINSSDYRVLPNEYKATIDGVKLKTDLIIGFSRN